MLQASSRTKDLDFRRFDSSIVLISKVGIPMPMGNLPEILSQQILARITLVRKLGVRGDLQVANR